MDDAETIALPSDEDVDLEPPQPDEVAAVARGVAGAIAVDGTLRPIQTALMEATFESMTGFRPSLDPLRTVEQLAETLRHRNLAYRTRIFQQALLGALVTDPIPAEVVERIRRLGTLLGVEDDMLATAQQFADRQFELAAIDFDRNGYTADWNLERASALHASRPLDHPWRDAPDDPDLAARWRSLESMPDGSLGQAVARFYRARGFAYPGTPGSVSPLLAQHDWVHVLADYGSALENELEVFAFIARANDDPRGFSFLAMVVSLFETGTLLSGAGLFEPDPGHLSATGMPERLADAMLRGALCDGSIDFLAVDWFEHAHRQLDELRGALGITAKRAELGAPGPFDPGGINEFQHRQGREAARSSGVDYVDWIQR